MWDLFTNCISRMFLSTARALLWIFTAKKKLISKTKITISMNFGDMRNCTSYKGKLLRNSCGTVVLSCNLWHVVSLMPSVMSKVKFRNSYANLILRGCYVCKTDLLFIFQTNTVTILTRHFPICRLNLNLRFNKASDFRNENVANWKCCCIVSSDSVFICKAIISGLFSCSVSQLVTQTMKKSDNVHTNTNSLIRSKSLTFIASK